MGAFFGAIVAWFLDLLRGKTPAVSRVEVQTDRAAVAETKLSQETQANVQVQKAVQATREFDDALARDPDSLRAPSPDSRD